VRQDHQRDSPGLRERKKARTRTTIQHCALRLFGERGYEATTMDQIAEEAEVSPSTLLRYFPTKETLVLTDHYDSLIIDALRAQPSHTAPIQAFREALRAGFGTITADELPLFRERQRLAFTVPQLRQASHDQLGQSMYTLAGILAERTGHQPDDLAIRSLTGALIGVILSTMLHWAQHPDIDPFDALDQALTHLQAGLPV
jgi:AcrR family transcriptional regulator